MEAIKEFKEMEAVLEEKFKRYERDEKRDEWRY